MVSAAPEPGSADFYEFGPFQLDVSNRGLYRAGEYVPLPPKAFEILLVLVQDAGRVITKEQLLQRVWPDVVVEEGSISNNISTLRKLLNPHFGDDGPIATVARRGYRFSAAVRLRNARAEITPVREAPPPVAAPAAISWHAARRFSARQVAVGAALLLGLAAIVGLALRWVPAPKAAPSAVVVRRAVAVLPLRNLGGQKQDDWLSTALMETITAHLAVGGQLRMISGASVADMQHELRPPPGVGLSRKQLDEIGKNLGCDLILTGNYLPSAGRIRVDVRLDDIASGEPVAALSVVEDEGKLLDLVASASRELRLKIGVAAPLAAQAAGVRAALSSNPAALRFYFLGLEALRLHEGQRSVELLTQAVTEDPEFALAHSVLSITWRLMGHDQRSREEAQKAFELSGRLGREDQLAVEGAYYEVSHDWPKAIEKYQSLWSFFPDNVAYGLKLFHMQMLAGRLDDAKRVVDQMKLLPPPANGDARVDLAAADLAFRRGELKATLSEATRAAEKAAARKATVLVAAARLRQARASHRLGQPDAARSAANEAEQLYERLGDLGQAAEAERIDASVLLSLERYDEARKQADAALAAAKRIGHTRLEIEVRVLRAALELQQGRLAAARSEAEAALRIAREARIFASAARALTLLAEIQKLQADHKSARASLDEAATIASQNGEQAALAAAMDGLAAVDLAVGRVQEARRRLEEILPRDRARGDKATLALKLARLSSALTLQGHLAEAEKLVAEECGIHQALGAAGALAGCRVRGAELLMDQGHAAAARAAAQKLAAEQGTSKLRPIDLARLAEVQLRGGDAAGAASTIAEARRGLSGREPIPEQTLAVTIAGARVDAAAGRTAEARQKLTQAQADSERLGLLPLALEARLALAESNAQPNGRADAAALERDARQAGLGLIADRARAVGGAAAPPPR